MICRSICPSCAASSTGAIDQFPVLRDIAVKEHRGGLPTMTADGEHIVGPLPGIRGLYVAGGCCVGGLSIAPIIGELLAEWIISGKPPIDLAPLSPARLAVQTTTRRRFVRIAAVSTPSITGRKSDMAS